MIQPPGDDGVAFSEKSDGDLRRDPAARALFTQSLGISQDWAVVRQVHGNEVTRVSDPGSAGEADAVWTTEPGLPVAIFTADCFGVALVTDAAVGVAHAGWRGAAAGVVTALIEEMAKAGHRPQRAAVGPGIGPCCFEVGSEVAEVFGAHLSSTTWASTSVDLPAVISAQLEGLQTWTVGGCTHHDEAWFSHRRDAAPDRMAALAWVQ